MKRVIFFSIFLVASLVAHSQQVVNLTNPLELTQTQPITIVPGQCLTAEVGDAFTFVREAGCGANLFITDPDDIVVWDSNLPTADLTVLKEGTYRIDCNSSTLAVGIPFACIDVGPASQVEPIPTMQEWGVLILFLLLVIFAAVAMMNYYGKTDEVIKA